MKRLVETNTNKLSTNQYDTETERVKGLIAQIVKESSDFAETDTEATDLNSKLQDCKIALDTYLKGQGIGQDDIDDYERAVSQIPIINAEIEQLTTRGQQTNLRIKGFEEYLKSETLKDDFKNKVLDSLQPLNEQLKSSNPNVLDISFTYEFDEESALNNLFDEFETNFKEFKPSEHATKNDSVREYLLCVSPLEVDDYDTYMGILQNKKSSANSKMYILDLFEKKDNFDIYKLLIKKLFSNSFKYKKIIGYYGGKQLEDCSFGQRCTAVIVALLMFGNKPLLIDEPEAHLDSKLIAEYLVRLIKDNKVKRQIIFATHNANFVINGDAELIHILEVDDENRTIITSTSIENLENREKLLLLEGGRNAFETRDKKLLKLWS